VAPDKACAYSPAMSGCAARAAGAPPSHLRAARPHLCHMRQTGTLLCSPGGSSQRAHEHAMGTAGVAAHVYMVNLEPAARRRWPPSFCHHSHRPLCAFRHRRRADQKEGRRSPSVSVRCHHVIDTWLDEPLLAAQRERIRQCLALPSSGRTRRGCLRGAGQSSCASPRGGAGSESYHCEAGCQASDYTHGVCARGLMKTD
jgi:hypothetical protein